MSDNGKVRVQLDLRPAEAEALDALRDTCGLSSRTDAVRTALAVSEWVKSETNAGRKIFAVDEEGVRALVVPGLTTSF